LPLFDTKLKINILKLSFYFFPTLNPNVFIS
jgi:hypothetical protein